MDTSQVIQLIEKYNAGECNAEEKALLETWYLRYAVDRKLDLSNAELNAATDRVWDRLQPSSVSSGKIIRWKHYLVAASVIICLSFGAYFLVHKDKGGQIITKRQNRDLAPGTNKAILTIGNGSKIILTGAQNGKLAVQGNAVIDKTADGRIIYRADLKYGNAAGLVIYNTMTTPRGGKYDLVLSDGTKVWLDAASSITYPAQFSGGDREVKMTGQAYFEVAHNAAKPFRVLVNGQKVEVLGTHFNINAYADEPDLRTTLLAGSVKVSRGREAVILSPGQQSVLSSNSINVKTGGIEDAIAWKEGHFHFEGADIRAVMRQLARWYDVEVEYRGDIPPRAFNGDIDRNSKASVVLQILSLSKVNFKIEGKKIIVMP